MPQASGSALGGLLEASLGQEKRKPLDGWIPVIIVFALASAVQVLVYSPIWGDAEWSILGLLSETTESPVSQVLLVGSVFFVLPALLASGVSARLLWGTYPSSSRLPVAAIALILLLAIVSAYLGALASYAVWAT